MRIAFFACTLICGFLAPIGAAAKAEVNELSVVSAATELREVKIDWRQDPTRDTCDRYLIVTVIDNANLTSQFIECNVEAPMANIDEQSIVALGELTSRIIQNPQLGGGDVLQAAIAILRTQPRRES